MSTRFPAPIGAPAGAPTGAPPTTRDDARLSDRVGDRTDRGDKRTAILGAALHLIARSGLHATPTAAIAQAAGVGPGTLFRYFPSKEALVNVLYLEVLAEQHRAIAPAADSGASPTGDTPADTPDGTPEDVREALWRAWSGLVRWHLDRPEASNVLRQCRASGILTEETRAAEREAKAAGLAQLEAGVRHGRVRDLPRKVFMALLLGPIGALVEMHQAGELDVTDAVLRATFDGISRNLLPAPDA